MHNPLFTIKSRATSSRYESVPSIYERKPQSRNQKSARPASLWRKRLSRLWFFITQLLSFLWLAPIVSLLYLNFSRHINGPSVSCPSKGCKADPLAVGDAKWALDLNRKDHNVLGALQLVSKALELWFLFVAVSFVYNIAMLIASHTGGLPIGLFSSPLEFADPRSLYDMFRAAAGTHTMSEKKQRPLNKYGLYLFVLFLAFMCLLVNLMGPAVAVLVLPTLQWIGTLSDGVPFRSLSCLGSSIFKRCASQFNAYPNAKIADCGLINRSP